MAARRRRRRWRVVGWMGVAAVAAVGVLLVGWELAAGWWGVVAGVRWVGYVGVVILAAGAGLGVVRWGRRGIGGEGEVVRRLERLFPQARGVLRDAWGGAAEGSGAGELQAVRADIGRRWLAARGGERLDGALAESDRALGRRARRVTAALAVSVALAA
ncbi:MAG: hypothetical protein ABR559_00230, partial [Gemmatimonadota bacterium]